jgi:hypothetical protein
MKIPVIIKFNKFNKLASFGFTYEQIVSSYQVFESKQSILP